MPVILDVDIWRGNNLPPVEWPWPDGYAGTALCQLTVWVGDELIFSVDSGEGITIDPTGRRFVWERTVAQSREIPLGRIAQYELEDRAGGERTLFAGVLVGLGGRNLDTDIPPPDGSLDFSYSLNSGQELDGWI